MHQEQYFVWLIFDIFIRVEEYCKWSEQKYFEMNKIHFLENQIVHIN